MLFNGIIILDNGKWKEIDFKKEETKFDSHEEFARQYIANNQDLNNLFQDYKFEYKKFSNRYNKPCIVDPVDFLLQYFGFIKIGVKINTESRNLIFYKQSPEYNESQIGKERSSIINLYRSRGFVDETNFNNDLPDFVYDMQNENKFFNYLYSTHENIR